MGLKTWVKSALGLKAADPALDERYWASLDGPMSAAGVRVSADSALRVSAVYRCVSILANSAAMLPGGVYRKLTAGRQEIPDHMTKRLLWRYPNPYQRPFEFKRVMFAWAILRGAAFARIYRRTGGELELWPLHPDHVTGPELLDGGVRRYVYRNPITHEEERYLADRDILVVNGLSLDGLRGLALSDLARDTIGSASATEQYGAQLFARGARFSGGLELPAGKTIADPAARQRLSDSIRKQGAGPGQWWGVPVFEDGMKWANISMTADDAQFLETRHFTVADIARWFGLPPHMIGEIEKSTSWGTGIEAQTVGFVTYALMPWLTLFEQCFEAALITEPDAYLRFNVAGLLRADVKTRFDVYALAIQNGIYSPNDCRELEDDNPREGGDVYVTPTAPQQSPRGTGAAEPAAEQDDEQARLALAGKIGALESRLIALETLPSPAEDTHTRALRAVREGAAELGIPKDAVRKLLANAKPKAKEGEDQHA
jgi:HK97 family phage portal protein